MKSESQNFKNLKNRITIKNLTRKKFFLFIYDQYIYYNYFNY